MKRHVSRIMIAGLLVTLAVGAASAQSTVTAKASIPFDFIIGNKMLPAGDYELVSNVVPGTLVIRSSEQKVGMFTLVHDCNARAEQEKSKLLFNRYGSSYFLSQMWIAGNNTGLELAPGSREKETARHGASYEVAVVFMH